MVVETNVSDGDSEEVQWSGQAPVRPDLTFLLPPQPMDTAISEELFPQSRLPPVQLPLDVMCHSRHRALPLKQAKVKLASWDEQTGDSSPVKSKPIKPVRQIRPTSTTRHEVTAAELFTPSEVHVCELAARLFVSTCTSLLPSPHARTVRVSSYSCSSLIACPYPPSRLGLPTRRRHTALPHRMEEPPARGRQV